MEHPAGIYPLKINTRKRRQWRRFGVFIVNFEHISHIFSSVFVVNFGHVIAGWACSFDSQSLTRSNAYYIWIKEKFQT